MLELENDDSRNSLHQPDARLIELLHPVDDVDLEFRPPTECFDDPEACAFGGATARGRDKSTPRKPDRYYGV